MKKAFLSVLFLGFLAVSAFAQGGVPFILQEVDGSPKVQSPTIIKVSNGTLTCVQKVCTISTGGGGGGGTPGGLNTQVQFNQAGSFGGISGFTSDGTNVTAGSANLRATRPRFITSIDDTNGNEVFIITATGSAVNEFTIANAATGSGPSISTSGGDTNIDMYLIPKGTGSIYFGSATTNSSARAGIGFIAKNAEKFWAQDSSNNNLAILDSANGLRFATGMLFGWTASSTNASGAIVTGLARAADAVIRVTGSGTAAGSLIIGTSAGAIGTSGAGVLAFTLSTEPSTSPTDTTQLYYKDFAAGDGRLYLRNEASAAGSPVANLGDAQTFTGRITFSPGATTAGINVGSVAGNPSGPSNADLWYNTATNELYARINGANVALGSGGGGGITIGTTTITSGTNTRVLYNNAGVVGEYVITGTGNVVMSASPTLTGTVAMAAATASGTIVQTSASATAFESGPNGSTNPVFRLVNNVASAASGVSITGRADGTAPTVQTISRTQQTASIAGNGLEVRADDAVAGSITAGAAAGGALTLQSGAAARLTSGNANGGNINIVPGAGIGTGVRGQVVISDNGSVLNDVMLRFSSGATNQGWTNYFGWAYMYSGASVAGFINADVRLASTTPLGWTNFSVGSTIDAGFNRLGVGAIRVITSSSNPGNLLLGTSSGAFGTSAAGVLGFSGSTAPSTSTTDTVQLYSNDSAAGDHNLFSRNEAGQINRLTGLAARNSAQFDKTSDTTLANVTGLTENVEASRVYGFRAVIRTTAAATGGIKLSVSGTATMTNINYEGILFNGATVTAQTRATALDTAVCAVTNTTAGTCVIEGAFTVNAAGTLTIQFAQNASDGTASSVLVNSTLQLIPIS